ncbi:MAG: MFS transporter, partial [Acutalibacteraceae bacterium]
MKIIEKAKGLITKIITGWREPPEGRFLNIQEIAAYGVGGMGLHFMFSLLSYSITAQMLPKMYGITPTQATFLVTLVSIIKLVVMPWFYSVFDNLHSERGKYRSFISVMAPLLALFSVLATFAPQFNGMENSQTLRTVYAFCICIPVLLLSQLLSNIYNMMPTSMTPVSQERADMLSPASILYSFAPTVIGWVFNPLRGVFQARGQEYLAYRYMGIIFSVFGVALAFILVFKTKERTYAVTEKTEKIKFTQGLKSVFQNKPFILFSIYGLFGVFKTLVDSNVVYVYDYRLSEIVGNGPKISGI